jgi:hypothetical protein
VTDHCDECARVGRATIAFVTVHDKRGCRLLCWAHAKKCESESFLIGHSENCPYAKVKK